MFSRIAISAAVALTFALAATTASANDVRCTQAFLDFKGYDPGPIDGAFGGKTAAAAVEFVEDTGTDIAELTRETAADWCALARADADFARLLDYDYAAGALWQGGVTSNRNVDQILLGDSPGNFVLAERNVGNSGALGFIELDGGYVAARIRVLYEDEGHRDDWFWNDDPGVQQRFELAEERSFSMRPGETWWLRMSVFIPGDVFVANRDQLVLSDLKPRTDRALLDPLLNIKLGDRYFQIDHLIGRPYTCAHGYSEGGHENTVCDQSKEQAFIAPTGDVRDRWINLVYRFRWADDDSGRFHLWVDDELVMGMAGVSSHGGQIIQNKFGIYRGFYGSQGTPQPPARIYFAGVGRAETCAGIGLQNCAALEADLERIETPGVIGRNYVEDTALTDYLAAGGEVMQ